MALLEYWVDPDLGNNANAGTRAAPFRELRYATSTVIASAQGVNDTVIINVVPCKPLDGAEQYIRLDAADWTGGRLVVRSAIPGLPWIVGATGARLIWAVGACNANVEIYDCQATTVRILEWAGLTVASATGVRLRIGEGCRFTNSTNSGSADCFNFDSDASESSLQIDSGVVINRWASLCFGTFLRTVLIDGLTFNSLDGLARTTNIFADSLTIKNSTFRWPTSLNHVFIAQSRLTELIITDNTFDMLSTNGATSFWFDAPPTGVSSVNCSISGNTFTATSPAPVVHVGNVLVDTNNRATNDATRGQFAACTITENDIVQRNVLGGGLRVMIGTTGAVVTKNYIRHTNLVDADNVHVAYLYGDGVQFRENFVQGSVLAFGPNQKVFDNVAVAKQNALLLGGTQGGSQAIGGGNNYSIGGNILMSVGAACLNDYAYNGAYPTNLGTLTAESNNNVYVPLAGSQGAVQLTAAGLFGTTTEQVRNLWNSSALSGSGSVWGASTNANNDSFSRVATGAELSWYQSLRDCNGGVFTRADFERIRGYADMRQAEYIADLTADRIDVIDSGGSSGDYTLTVTVIDSSTADEIEGATITLSRTGQRSVETTNASGVAAIGVDAATWTYVVRAGGYASKTGTVVVSANQSLAVELDAIVLPAPSNPDTSALVILCLDANGDPEPDVSIDIRIITVPSGDQNIAYKGTKQTATSDANGYATLQAIKGAVYEYKRGKAEVWSKVTIGSGSATNVQSVIGSP